METQAGGAEDSDRLGESLMAWSSFAEIAQRSKLMQ